MVTALEPNNLWPIPCFLAAFVDTCACQLAISIGVLDVAQMRSIFLLMFLRSGFDDTIF